MKEVVSIEELVRFILRFNMEITKDYWVVKNQESKELKGRLKELIGHRKI